MGAAKSGAGVASMGVMRPELVMKSIVPVVMAGFYDGYAHLSSGLACGLAAGMAAIGIVGDAGWCQGYQFSWPLFGPCLTL
ncbi:hypothetical protein Bca52824_095124 [Brassica carinata]|uniref:Uncharacterized protein n=1 Tax=Brassica carinata TaxID=52824 RepID=A0A8X7P436_BRACI|nr:hypothetical protein Bca52824_095124 [Brassica carinata]